MNFAYLQIRQQQQNLPIHSRSTPTGSNLYRQSMNFEAHLGFQPQVSLTGRQKQIISSKYYTLL